jgi:hypothetical protein
MVGGLCVVALLLAAFSAKLFCDYSFLRFRAHFAKEQISIFDGMSVKAIGASPEQAADCLRYTQNYYPSGTKQVNGSDLDAIVERERAEALRAIINYLRERTGEDLGDLPEPWIGKYAKE